jgi:hypothetical protein
VYVGEHVRPSLRLPEFARFEHYLQQNAPALGTADGSTSNIGSGTTLGGTSVALLLVPRQVPAYCACKPQGVG